MISNPRLKHTAMAAAATALSLAAGAAQAATPLVAKYLFDNSLASSVAGAPSLTAVDPLGTSGFVQDTVEGSALRNVYRFDGSASPSQQGGLNFDASGLLGADYSVALTFELDATGGYRRVLDTLDRQSDSGFYILNSTLDIYPQQGTSPGFTANTYHNVVITVAGDGTIGGYIDNVQSFTTNSSVLALQGNNIVGLFLDNVAAGGQGEWSAGQIAAASFYDGILSADEIAEINRNPLLAPPTAGGVPEPASWALMLVGFGGLGATLRSRRKATLAGV